jgi:hypothetical protein
MAQDHETVIVDNGGNSTAGIIAGVVAVVLIVLGFLWFFNGSNQGTGGTIDVDVPAVSVDVQPDGQ